MNTSTLLERYATDKPKDNNERIVFSLIDELSDRGGFDGWWGNIDGEIQQEILESLVKVLENK